MDAELAIIGMVVKFSGNFLLHKFPPSCVWFWKMHLIELNEDCKELFKILFEYTRAVSPDG